MHLQFAFSLLLAIVTVNNSENKFGVSRNSTRSFQGYGGNNYTDLMKTEIKKYLSECGVESSGEDGSESRYSSSRNSSYGYGNGNNGNRDNGGGYHSDNSGGYHSSYNDEQNRRNYGSWDRTSHKNNDRSSGYGSSYNSQSGQSRGSSDSNRNQDDARVHTGFGNWDSNSYGQNSGSYGSFQDTQSTSGSYNRNPGYQSGQDSSGYYGDRTSYGTDRERGRYERRPSDEAHGTFRYADLYQRSKRSDEDAECISQCVFGYLEVLDDNRSPSESAMIKWLQDHMPNDGKRIKALRDMRRCFARLAASDNDDGCEFSKSLSKCLNLDIED